jgi:hypothetical protein
VRQAIRHVLGRGHGDSWLELCLDDQMIREVRDHLNGLLPQDQVSLYYNNVNTAASGVTVTRFRT